MTSPAVIDQTVYVPTLTTDGDAAHISLADPVAFLDLEDLDVAPLWRPDAH